MKNGGMADETLGSEDSARKKPSRSVRPWLCVPICATRAEELRAAVARAAEIADFIELRLDYLQGDELFKALRSLPALIRTSPRPIIVTLRPAEQGGAREMENLTRLVFWVEHFLYGKPHIDLADIELDLVRMFQQREKDENRAIVNWERVICSAHYFGEVPGDLVEIFNGMSATPARAVKIAIQAHDATDCLKVFEILDHASGAGREIIALAMGDAGIMTRILGPSRGGFLTYGALDEFHKSAEGQILASDLRDVYRVDAIKRDTAIFGVIGSPIAHSLSPEIHNAAFKHAGLNAVYIPFEVIDVEGFLRRMVRSETREADWDLRGLSVTLPHKLAVMALVDRVDPTAQTVGAINTIVVHEGALVGYNTDVSGFMAALDARSLDLQGAQCAIIGAGGAARCALYALRSAGAHTTLFARDLEKGSCVGNDFEVECRELDGAQFGGFDLVVNATPLGTVGTQQNESPASVDQLRGARLVYDMVYNPAETVFVQRAREAGSEAIGGIEMLVAQAAEQFRLWTGQVAPADVMMYAARRKLSRLQ